MTEGRYKKGRNLLVLEKSRSIYLIPPEGKPVRLNFEASFIWTSVTLGRGLDAVVDAYRHEFALAPEVAEGEVKAFVRRMCEAGFIVARRP